MTISIILFIFCTLILVWIANRHAYKSDLPLIISGWIIKCIVGLTFIYVYTYYYGNGTLSQDSGAYFREAEILAQIKNKNSTDFYSILFEKEDGEKLIAKYFEKNPNSRISRPSIGINDTRIHIKFISVVMLFIGVNYLSILILFFFLSYLGILLLWFKLKNKVNIHPTFSLGLLLLPPNLLFWTSSNLKEVMFILGLCLLLTFYLSNKKYLKSVFFGTVGLLLLSLFKPILLVILFINWGFVQLIYRGVLQKKRVYLAIFISCVALLFLFSIPNKALQKLSDKQFDFTNVARGGIQVRGDTSFYYISSEYENKVNIIDSVVFLKEAITVVSNLFGKIRNETELVLRPNDEKLTLVYEQTGGRSSFEITPINNSWENLIKASPYAFLNAFFRPYFWENGYSKINLFFFLENIFFFVLFIYAMFHFKKVRKRHYNLALICFLTILSLSFIIGITTPISGAIVRYRIPIQLLIIIVFLLTKIKHEQAK